jgi:hypothetical protein
MEPNTTCKEYKDSAHIYLVDHLISHISPIWTPIIVAEVRKLQLCPVWNMCENSVFMLVPYKEFVSLSMTSILIVPWF